MERIKIQYIRRGHKNTGVKRGVLICEVDDLNPDNVNVGFSLCNAIDRYDYPGGERTPGFGLSVAVIRARKWKHHIDCFVQLSHNEEECEVGYNEIEYYVNPDKDSVVEIPPSIVKPLENFIYRCRLYYKDKTFPMWVEKFENNDLIEVELNMHDE